MALSNYKKCHYVSGGSKNQKYQNRWNICCPQLNTWRDISALQALQNCIRSHWGLILFGRARVEKALLGVHQARARAAVLFWGYIRLQEGAQNEDEKVNGTATIYSSASAALLRKRGWFLSLQGSAHWWYGYASIQMQQHQGWFLPGIRRARRKSSVHGSLDIYH